MCRKRVDVEPRRRDDERSGPAGCNMEVTVTIPGKTERVLALIRGHPDGRTGLAVRTIANLLGVPPGPALRMILSRAVKHGKLRRLDNGVYGDVSSYIEPALPDPRVRFHGLGAYS